MCWDRRGEVLIGVHSPRQIRWLRRHLSDYLARITRVLREDVDDSVVAAVLATRRITSRQHAGSCLAETVVSVTTSLESLPDNGGVVELRDDEARWHWVWAVHELRIAMEARLGDGVRSDAAAKLMVWLRQVVDEVVGLGELPLGIGSPHSRSRPLR